MFIITPFTSVSFFLTSMFYAAFNWILVNFIDIPFFKEVLWNSVSPELLYSWELKTPWLGINFRVTLSFPQKCIDILPLFWHSSITTGKFKHSQIFFSPWLLLAFLHRFFLELYLNSLNSTIWMLLVPGSFLVYVILHQFFAWTKSTSSSANSGLPFQKVSSNYFFFLIYLASFV